jgi:hydroxyacylglutathione hydrolase
MPEYKINTITLPMPFHLGWVNFFLLSTASGCLLIDTGSASARTKLLAELERLGCTAGSLNLVLLTHGDYDHTGNAAVL